MRSSFLSKSWLLGIFLSGWIWNTQGGEVPNILFIIADDASRHFGQAYDCDWVRTPHIDKLAEEGLVFDNAYVATSKCAPCRASTMTGRFPWQIEAGANHQNVFLYVNNFEPDRWPCGNIELGLKETDRSPTKLLLMEMGMETAFWKHNFGKRPADMLFNVVEDPDCVVNLASETDYAERMKEMKNRMMKTLREQGDPRAMGNGEVFDNYPTVKPAPKGWESNE